MDMQPARQPATQLGSAFVRLIKSLLALVLIVAVSGAAAYFVVDRELKTRLESGLQDQKAIRSELEARQKALEDKVAALEKAVLDAKLLVPSGDGQISLADKLKEIDGLKESLTKLQVDTAEKMTSLEASLQATLGQKNQETAAALSASLRLKSLLFKADSEILKAKVELSEGNRGRAKDELSLAETSLNAALKLAGDDVKPSIQGLLLLLQETRAALITEAPTGRDSLELLWHKTGELISNLSK